MSGMGGLVGKRFLVGVLLTIVTVLVVSAGGAALAVAGVLAVDRAWTAGCAAWLLAGLIGGRFAIPGAGRRIVWSVLNVAASAALFWLAGLTTPAGSGSFGAVWPWYLGCGILGAVAAVLSPVRKKRRRKGKRGK